MRTSAQVDLSLRWMHILIRVLVIRFKKLCIFGCSKCTQGRFRSDCANAQGNRNLHRLTRPKVSLFSDAAAYFIYTYHS